MSKLELEYRALPKFNQESVLNNGSALKFNTLLFSRYWTEFDFTKPIRILDLGSIRSSTIDFFSEYPCYITISNSIDELANISWDRELETQSDFTKRINEIIPVQEQEYDLVFVWDCLNYLSADILKVVHQRLLSACHRNTRIYGFLYTSEIQNVTPWSFDIYSHSKMSSHARTEVTRHVRPLNSLKLMQYLPQFKLDRSVLILNGMQEFLLKQN